MRYLALILLSCLLTPLVESKPKKQKIYKVNKKERKKIQQRDDLYARIAPAWFNVQLRREYAQLLQTASLDEQIDWLRDQIIAKEQLENERDNFYAEFVDSMTETQRYNYGQQPTLREQVQWLKKYEKTLHKLPGGLQEYDDDGNVIPQSC